MKVMRYKQKGEITIFAALIMSVLIMFIYVVTSGIRRYVAKSEVIMDMDAALVSCFYEYNKYMYETYHMKYIDTSYKDYEISDDNLTNHMMTYMQECMKEGNSIVTGLTVSNIQLQDVHRAGDNNYANMYEQIKKYCVSKDNTLSECDKKTILCAYIQECFGNDSAPGNNSIRVGEEEYIIYGYATDTLNRDAARADYEEYVYDNCVEECLYFDEYIRYEDYISRRIQELSYETIMHRIAFLINENLSVNGSPNTDVEKCIYSASVVAEVESLYGYDYTINREYTYDD